uniref:General transcription factor 3C polypeptide 1-like n=1 Tax=Phallusia mammillata TaxID=59560 RepID=A0A6F9DEY0_9ASCI|nr:general transcription factor 3C polypeptide 1-like [Phallusia mammillata]
MDIFAICIQEIALEGLDGITIQALWLRLLERKDKIPIVLTDLLKSHLWQFLIHHDDILFYALDNERQDPIIFDRFSGYDQRSGCFIASAPDELDTVVDIYPVKPVNDEGIKGSCPEFKSRLEVSEVIKEANMGLDDATNRFGAQQLVAVASQSAREMALLPSGVHPQVIEELTELEYCILERIGRSRWQGEIQTVLNTLVFRNLKTSHIHYVMKSLTTKGLVLKQAYAYRRRDKGDKLYQQILLHVRSFQTIVRSQLDHKSDEMCAALYNADNKTMSLQNVRLFLGMADTAFKKLKRKLIMEGVIEVVSKDKKGSRGEKDIRLIKKSTNSKPVEETEEDTDLPPVPPSGSCIGLVAELPVVLQGFRHLVSTGEEGCSQLEMLKLFVGYGSLEGRHVCRKIEKAGIVRTIMIEHGKHRVQKYIAKDYAINSKLTKQFLAERKKMQEIFETSVMSAASADDDTANASETTMENSLSQAKSPAPSTNAASTSDQESNRLVSVTTDEDTPMGLDESVYCEEMSVDPTLNTSKWKNHLTTRRMRRSNLILGFINEQKVTEGLFFIQKFLYAEESKLGETSKICKKTVSRTIKKMDADGLLKHVVVPITSNDVTHKIEFVTSLDCSSARFNIAIEQAQFRVLSSEAKKSAKNFAEEHCKTDIPLSQTVGIEIHDDAIKMEDLLPTPPHQSGYQPKHIRAKAVHCYLWYLAYGHPGIEKPNSDQNVIDFDKVYEYNTERSWKRYLPPLPKHPEYGEGWIQVGEAGFLLPLSIICQFQRYTYKIPGIEEYLNDPIRRHTLVRHLPSKMQALLLHKRKYLFSLTQVIEMLCFMGLVTMSQQKFQNSICLRKEEEMVYIHRNASIKDTTQSDKSYMQVSDSTKYGNISFTFPTFTDVEKFWVRVKEICLMTPLGLNNNHEGDSERHTIPTKKFIQNHVKREKRQPKDDGSTPGDGKGAGGFDSSLFSHLYRNWFRNIKTKGATDGISGDLPLNGKAVERLPGLVTPKIKALNPSPKKRKRNSTGPRKRKQSVEGGVAATSKKKKRVSNVGTRKRKASQTQDTTTDPDYEVVTTNNVGRNEAVKGGRGVKRKQRRESAESESPVVPKKSEKFDSTEKTPKKKKYVDPVDVQSLKLLVEMTGKQRSSFSAVEDAMLLVCKIASSIIISQTLTKLKVIPLIAVRDVLREHCAESRDKTSYACGRRIRAIMLNDHNIISHQISVADAMADQEFMATAFSGCKNVDAQKIPCLFKNVVSLLQARLKRRPGQFDMPIPDTVKELNRRFNTVKYKSNETSETFGRTRTISDIRTESDIVRCVLETLIYSTLYLDDDHYSKFQAFKVFEKFPEDLVHRTWELVRASGSIKGKKEVNTPRQTRYPFGVPAYRLSLAHYKYFEQPIAGLVYKETSESNTELERNNSIVCGIQSSTGAVVLMAAGLLSGNIVSDIQVPESIASFSNRFEHSDSSKKKSLTHEEDDDVSLNPKLHPRHVSDDYESDKNKDVLTHTREYVSLNPCTVTLRKPSLTQGLPHVTQETDRDLRKGLQCLHCRTVASDDVIVDDGDDAIRRDVTVVVRNCPELVTLATEMLDHVLKAGAMGVVDWKLIAHFTKRKSYEPSLVQQCFERLCNTNIFYIVGKHQRRFVTRHHATKWCVEGVKFKGDRTNLSARLRYEMTSPALGATDQAKGKTTTSSACDVISIVNTVTPSPAKVNDTANEAANDMPAEKSFAKDSLSLLDASSYDPITFICRPWHNVCGEIQPKTALMIMTGVFQQIFWYPGVTLENLTRHFAHVMQRIEVIEMTEVLVQSGCVEKRRMKPKPSWQLFGKKTSAIGHLDGEEQFYFIPAPDAVFRMSEIKKLLLERSGNTRA